MKTDLAIPLAALALLAAATATASRISFPADGHTIDLPSVTAHASPQDVAYFRAHRIVDLPPVAVRPEPADLAWFLADHNARVVHLPVSLPQASALQRQMTVISSDALAER